VRYAIEELPPQHPLGTCLEVEEARFLAKACITSLANELLRPPGAASVNALGFVLDFNRVAVSAIAHDVAGL
jgi:hypothetical protein